MDSTNSFLKSVPHDLFVSKLPNGEKEFFCFICFESGTTEQVNRLSWRIRSTRAKDNFQIGGERATTGKERESCRIPLSVLLSPEFDDGELTINLDCSSSVKAGTWKILSYRQKGEFRLPLDGQVLIVMGHRIGEAHRSAFQIPTQQFGWDLLPFQDNGLRLIKGVLPENLVAQDFEGFGQAVLAPADGIVLKAVDGNPDLEHVGQLPENLDYYLEDPIRATGNYVILDHGNQVCSIVGHLRRGSVRVKEGQEVKVSDKLGELGNSGFSSGPHVHLQFMNGPDILAASPLPIELNLEGGTYSPQAGEITSSCGIAS
jgi:murein DD-endopeptidase MepM/ murein hydrolase activator NlpD